VVTAVTLVATDRAFVASVAIDESSLVLKAR